MRDFFGLPLLQPRPAVAEAVAKAMGHAPEAALADGVPLADTPTEKMIAEMSFDDRLRVFGCIDAAQIIAKFTERKGHTT